MTKTERSNIKHDIKVLFNKWKDIITDLNINEDGEVTVHMGEEEFTFTID